MERLLPADYEAVLAFLHRLYAVERPADFPQQAMVGLARLIPCDILSFNEIDPVRQRARMRMEPLDAVSSGAHVTFERLQHQHPLIRHYASTRDPGTRKISDFMGLWEFRDLELHHEFFAPLRIDYQMAVTIPSSPNVVIGIALNRSRRDFSERDRAVLDLVRPHLDLAFRKVSARATAVDDGLRASDAPLSSREQLVLDWVSRGKTNAEIGAQLAISPRTVQKHLEHVYDKLGVRSRTAAALRRYR